MADEDTLFTMCSGFRVVDLAVAEPVDGFVEQQQPGPYRERPGEFDAFERAERQPGGGVVGDIRQTETP